MTNCKIYVLVTGTLLIGQICGLCWLAWLLVTAPIDEEGKWG